MWRIFKALFYLIVLGGIALVGYAYVGPILTPGDFAPVQEERRLPVTLETR